MKGDIDEAKIESDGTDLFVVVNGVRIARRGRKGTPQAKTWVSLEPGWRVLDEPPTMVIEYAPPRLQ
jgi:hypothetical protein